jgi:hypothetical protein
LDHVDRIVGISVPLSASYSHVAKWDKFLQ